MKKAKLTKGAIDNASAGEADRWLFDNEVPGFGVRIQPSGRKTYVLRYRNSDRTQRKHTIGRCCDMPPDQARALARKIYATIADGKDPAAERADARTAPTIKELSERYLKEHAEPYKKPASVKGDRQMWNAVILPKWGTRKVESITRGDVLTLHGSMAANPAKANHVLALLSKAFNLAETWEWRRALNPCGKVKKYKIPEVEAIMTPAQIAAVDSAAADMAATGEIPRPMLTLIRLLFLSGCRLNEIMSARQEWVDRERNLLVLPDSKVGQRKIALSEAAMLVIDSVPAGMWLIRGRTKGEHMKYPWALWRSVLKRAGVTGRVRIHDIRHTVGSLAHRNGLSQLEVARLLGHRNLSTTQRYLHGFTGDGARSAELVASVMAQASSNARTRLP